MVSVFMGCLCPHCNGSEVYSNSYSSSSDFLHFLCPDLKTVSGWLTASLSLGVFVLRAASYSVRYIVWNCQLGALPSCQTWDTCSSLTELHCNTLSRKEFTCRVYLQSTSGGSLAPGSVEVPANIQVCCFFSYCSFNYIAVLLNFQFCRVSVKCLCLVFSSSSNHFFCLTILQPLCCADELPYAQS